VNAARRVTVSLCIREGVEGALVVCRGCMRRRWMSWAEMRVLRSEEIEWLSYRIRLRCRRCQGTWFYIKPMSPP
jgi:hypothetical protein